MTHQFELAMTAPLQHQLVISIVSHGHGFMVRQLLEDLAREKVTYGCIRRVVVTLNIPEPSPPLAGWPFQLELVQNDQPLGFGANHNKALKGATETYVCVLNPDVRLITGARVLDELISALQIDGVGLAYPIQVDADGVTQDFERAMPTPWALLLRHTSSRRVQEVDWVNAAFLVARREVWEPLAGFDGRYFMYCEDVDLSLRVRLAGLTLARVEAAVVHSGQKASRRQLRHLWWHVMSLFRLWSSPVFYKAFRLLQRHRRNVSSIAPE